MPNESEEHRFLAASALSIAAIVPLIVLLAVVLFRGVAISPTGKAVMLCLIIVGLSAVITAALLTRGDREKRPLVLFLFFLNAELIVLFMVFFGVSGLGIPFGNTSTNSASGSNEERPEGRELRAEESCSANGFGLDQKTQFESDGDVAHPSEQMVSTRNTSSSGGAAAQGNDVGSAPSPTDEDESEGAGETHFDATTLLITVLLVFAYLLFNL